MDLQGSHLIIGTRKQHTALRAELFDLLIQQRLAHLEHRRKTGDAVERIRVPRLMSFFVSPTSSAVSARPQPAQSATDDAAAQNAAAVRLNRTELDTGVEYTEILL